MHLLRATFPRTSHIRQGLLTAILAGMLASGAASSSSSPPRIRIISPEPGAIVAGETPILVKVVPGDHPVIRVEIRVNGELLAALVHPPYRLTWDAGFDLKQHRIEARVFDEGGGSATAEMVSRRLPAGELVDVLLVTLYATVVNDKGKFVDGLKREDFQILEDGIPQAITGFSADPGGMHIALLIDTSRSMRGDRIQFARKAARAFLEEMKPDDRGMLLAFNETLRVVRDWTDSRQSLASGLAELVPEGGTALYDALYGAADLLAAVEGRKGMVVLSDGRDESYDGLGPGSLHTFREALEQAQKSEVILYTIGLGSHPDRDTDFSGRYTLAELLDRAALTTGGRSYLSTQPRKLKRIYQEVSRDLGHQYRLDYYSSRAERDGTWRKIDLRIHQPGHRARTRSGYFAPAD